MTGGWGVQRWLWGTASEGLECLCTYTTNRDPAAPTHEPAEYTERMAPDSQPFHQLCGSTHLRCRATAADTERVQHHAPLAHRVRPAQRLSQDDVVSMSPFFCHDGEAADAYCSSFPPLDSRVVWR